MPSLIHHLLRSINILYFWFPFKYAFLSPRDLVHKYHWGIIFQQIYQFIHFVSSLTMCKRVE